MAVKQSLTQSYHFILICAVLGVGQGRGRGDGETVRQRDDAIGTQNLSRREKAFPWDKKAELGVGEFQNGICSTLFCLLASSSGDALAR